MKKLLILILVLLPSIVSAQYFPYIPRYTNIPNTWDSTQTFGKNINTVGFNLYGNYNLGHLFKIALISPDEFNNTIVMNFNPEEFFNIRFTDSSTHIITSEFVINGEGQASINGTDPSLSLKRVASDTIQGRFNNLVLVADVIVDSNFTTRSFNTKIDSTGSIEDSVYIGRHTILVNCTASDSNVVWLSDLNITAGQEYRVKKIDANATNVIVKSKMSYPIDGAVSKIFNTQYQTVTFVYRNKTWYIL